MFQFFLKPLIEEIYDDEKLARKSPPESDKETKTRDRDISLSMAPLPIPLGPLGGFAGIFFKYEYSEFSNYFFFNK